MLSSVHVQARGCEVNAALRAHFETKLQALDKIWPRVDDAQVRLRLERGQHVAEITLFAAGLVTRAEERAHDCRTAFDAACAKLQTQLSRYKDKLQHRSRRQNNRDDVNGVVLHPKTSHDGDMPETATLSALAAPKAAPEELRPAYEADGDFLDGDVGSDSLVRVKKFALKPMSPDEAALQMDLLGHNFFVFRHAKDGSVGVVYKRSGGGYGLIDPVAD
ncbi:ribosome hibernation promotion factor [Abditibacteriota bacterium]|nr:ribosome hibernation promotion factor [Abditibacteriota bacterium]